MIISLTGFMGCGKSSVGRKLSELLCCRFMDLDAIIEASAGRTIPEIFDADGEGAFRRMEYDALNMVIDEYGTMPHDSDSCSLVLALGGGTVMTPECAQLVHDKTYCVYLRASIETLVSNLKDEAAGRPMLRTPGNQGQSPDMTSSPVKSTDMTSGDSPVKSPADSATTALRRRISELMALRSATYESVAHLTIDTDGRTIEEIAYLCAQA